jgi:hypothetical protein
MEARAMTVVNAHRQRVVEEIAGQVVRGPRGGVRHMTTAEIHRAEDGLIESGLVQDHAHFEVLANAKCREARDRFLRQKRAELNDAYIRLEALRRRPVTGLQRSDAY